MLRASRILGAVVFFIAVLLLAVCVMDTILGLSLLASVPYIGLVDHANPMLAITAAAVHIVLVGGHKKTATGVFFIIGFLTMIPGSLLAIYAAIVKFALKVDADPILGLRPLQLLSLGGIALLIAGMSGVQAKAASDSY